MVEEKQLIKVNVLTDKQRVLIYFFIYAFLGWILETVYCLLTLGVFQKRGFLYGPICPIYGIGAVLLILALRKIKGNNIIKFFTCMIVFSVFEYFVSYLLEILFGLRWWDYSNEFLNIQGRVSLVFSIAWGVLGVLFVEKIHPWIQQKIQKRIQILSCKKQVILISSLCVLLIIDTVFSVIKYLP